MLIVIPGADGIFQQDSAPGHAQKYPERGIRGDTGLKSTTKTSRYYPGPPNSPDLNPIQHLWDHLDHPPPTTLQQVWDALQTAWLELPVMTYQDHVDLIQLE